jgi:hypothetical protein
MKDYGKLLSGADLRSTGRSDSVAVKIKNQEEFDGLFSFLFHGNRLVVMRAADALEKITVSHPRWLDKHKSEIISLMHNAKNKELKWHLALMVPRLHLNAMELGETWDMLTSWAKTRGDSRLVRVSAVQGLYELTRSQNILINDFNVIMRELEREKIPSINARIRNIRKEMTSPQKRTSGTG